MESGTGEVSENCRVRRRRGNWRREVAQAREVHGLREQGKERGQRCCAGKGKAGMKPGTGRAWRFAREGDGRWDGEGDGDDGGAAV